MTGTEPMFSKLKLTELFVKSSWTEFYDNQTNSLVSDTRLQTDGWVWGLHRVFSVCPFMKNAPPPQKKRENPSLLLSFLM